jgi:hypothetical protein
MFSVDLSDAAAVVDADVLLTLGESIFEHNKQAHQHK